MIARAPVRQLRVAIYTRQSIASDLEFGSIQAQREAAEAYIANRRAEGWIALPTRFDDHGFSGGHMDRPAFERLLSDAAAGKIDVIAVYKFDRISRSLADFTGFLSTIERLGVDFVAITQSFDTRSPVGRLTIHVLASFAQFEREIIGERIRDKKRATRQRGLWTGGRPILGYDAIDKRLVVDPDEAEQVRDIFRLYLQLGSLSQTVAELKRRGWTNKVLTTRTGETIGGRPFTKSTLAALLANPILRGLVRCGSDLVAGAHEAIVEAELWEAVQAQLRANSRAGGAKAKNKTGALLRGLVRCGRCASPMLHTFTTRGSKRYGYYICARAHNEGAATCPDARVSAGEFERFVVEQVRAMGTDPELLARTATAAERIAADRLAQIGDERRRIGRQLRHLDESTPPEQVEAIRARDQELEREEDRIGDGTVEPETLRAALAGFEPIWNELFPAEQERILRLLVERITFDPDQKDVEIALRPCGIRALADEAGDNP